MRLEQLVRPRGSAAGTFARKSTQSVSAVQSPGKLPQRQFGLKPGRRAAAHQRCLQPGAYAAKALSVHVSGNAANGGTLAGRDDRERPSTRHSRSTTRGSRRDECDPDGRGGRRRAPARIRLSRLRRADRLYMSSSSHDISRCVSCGPSSGEHSRRLTRARCAG